MVSKFDKFPMYMAKTTVDITGACIDTIPAGTEFIVTGIDNDCYANAYGIGITSVYHYEYEIIGPVENSHK